MRAKLKDVTAHRDKGAWALHLDGGTADDSEPIAVDRGQACAVGVGAFCELHSAGQRSDRTSQSFDIEEYVQLDDGDRVVLRSGLGLTVTAISAEPIVSREMLVRDVLTVVEPDGSDPSEAHPWKYLHELARANGLQVTQEQLRNLPYSVVFGDRLEGWLLGLGK